MKDDDNLGLWEYIWGITFNEFLSTVRWSTIVFGIISVMVGYIAFGWIGVLIGWVFFYLMARAQDGAVADLWNDFPKEEFPPNTCSAGIEDCAICSKTFTYGHEFNTEYDKKYRKWWW